MCVILSIDDKDFIPSQSMLELCEKENPEGGGIAWLDGDKVCFKKNLTSQEIQDLIKSNQITPPYLVHFRIRSSGLVCPELCHPFAFENNLNDNLEGVSDKGVLFHNGTWHDWKSFLLETCLKFGCKLPDGNLSDSKVMAFLTDKYGFNFPQVIDQYGRVAILTPKGIMKFGEWKTVENISCSNDHFVEKPNYVGGYWENGNHTKNCNCYYCKTDSKINEDLTPEQEIIDLDEHMAHESEQANKEPSATVRTVQNDEIMKSIDNNVNKMIKASQQLRLKQKVFQTTQALKEKKEKRKKILFN